MTPYPHQVTIADEAYNVLSKYGMVYLGMEERTGKTLASILLAEKTTRTRVLVLTKKKALGGWYETLDSYATNGRLCKESGLYTATLHNSTYITVTNYHGVHRAVKKNGKTKYILKINPSDYDLIILDEAHSYLSAYPKLGAIWKSVKKLCIGQPIIYLSATPYAQGYQLLYNQLRLSDWSPFKQYKDFYRFFEVYGIPQKIKTDYGLQETYKKCKPSVWTRAKHLFVSYTRKDLGFEHEPTDVIHHFELSDKTREQYNYVKNKSLFITEQFESEIDSSMKLRTTLHMIEGGVAKVEDDYYILDNKEKIDAIKRDFGDTADCVIMYHYKAEFKKLSYHFKKARLLQATSYAEGVDLSTYGHLIIYSQDFSTARHSQRRARQANKQRKEPIDVHFYLVKGGISEQVYKTVSINKTNFIDSLFNRGDI